MLFIEAIPTIKETKTSGTAISFKELINILPKGEIQSSVKLMSQISQTPKPISQTTQIPKPIS